MRRAYVVVSLRYIFRIEARTTLSGPRLMNPGGLTFDPPHHAIIGSRATVGLQSATLPSRPNRSPSGIGASLPLLRTFGHVLFSRQSLPICIN
jgi:hypothetical protein